MRTEARHRLKEDAFAEGTREIFEWFVYHRTNIVGGVLVAAVIIAGYLAWWDHNQGRDQQANLQLGQALRTFQTPVGPAPPEQQPGAESYATTAARDKAAEQKFAALASQYGNLPAGRMAAYYIGVARMDSGDNQGAENQLKFVAGSRDKDLAALANIALASLYISSGRAEQAVPLCKALVDHPTSTVPKERAQLELASAYAQKQPQEAMKIYQQLFAADPTSPAAQVATSRMQALNPQ